MQAAIEIRRGLQIFTSGFAWWSVPIGIAGIVAGAVLGALRGEAIT